MLTIIPSSAGPAHTSSVFARGMMEPPHRHSSIGHRIAWLRPGHARAAGAAARLRPQGSETSIRLTDPPTESGRSFGAAPRILDRLPLREPLLPPVDARDRPESAVPTL